MNVYNQMIDELTVWSEMQLLPRTVEFLYVWWFAMFYVLQNFYAFVISTQLVTRYGLYGLQGMMSLLKLM